MSPAFPLTFKTKMNETGETQIPDFYCVNIHTLNAQIGQQALRTSPAFL